MIMGKAATPLSSCPTDAATGTRERRAAFVDFGEKAGRGQAISCHVGLDIAHVDNLLLKTGDSFQRCFQLYVVLNHAASAEPTPTHHAERDAYDRRHHAPRDGFSMSSDLE
jgi:hypothetical protein